MPSSEAGYCHRFTDGSEAPWLPGKTVCVGRNYADHARELNNPIPDEPLLFIKPATAMVPFRGTMALKSRHGVHHYETEMTLLIGKPLSDCSEQEGLDAIAGLGIGLDLTLRRKQNQLKASGHPWERAKAFDGSCVLSPFANADCRRLQALDIRLSRNRELVQRGNTSQMLFPVSRLLADISRYFSLMPGDVVMTGTPQGVGELQEGDHLVAELVDLVRVEAGVHYVDR